MLEFTWIPGLAAISAAIYDLGADIRSVKEPLMRSVREVAAPSIRTNFDVGGRPTWEPAAASTMANSRFNQLMVRTGALRDKASQVGVWHVDGQAGEAVLSADALPHYGPILDSGWSSGPARPFAVLQEEDMDKIADVFDRWLGERLAAAGLI